MHETSIPRPRRPTRQGGVCAATTDERRQAVAMQRYGKSNEIAATIPSWLPNVPVTLKARAFAWTAAEFASALEEYWYK
jgi:hypothetical protein